MKKKYRSPMFCNCNILFSILQTNSMANKRKTFKRAKNDQEQGPPKFSPESVIKDPNQTSTFPQKVLPPMMP